VIAAPAPIADEMAALLAGYAVTYPSRLSGSQQPAAVRVVTDSLAVALGGLGASAAVAARRYATAVGAPGACGIWGTSLRTTPELAALANGVPLRAYDYNDLYFGRRDAGHPSDIVPALVAIAEHLHASGAQLLAALCLGYDVILALLDTVTVSPDWDYPNLVALGATCAIGKLLRLDERQLAEALGITVASHAASGEIESGDLNARGDLTMWKRFNGADAMRQSVYACLLALAGVEGPVRPFVGKYGFLNLLARDGSATAILAQQLREQSSRIGDSTFKRWPVGSRAQSAVRAALEVRSRLASVRDIARVRVLTNPETYHHLLEMRSDPWNPASRETADHSLPYIVASALLDRRVVVSSFDPALVRNEERQRFLNQQIVVRPELPPDDGAAAFLTRIEVDTIDGTTLVADASFAPGHPLRPLSDDDFTEKFIECTAALMESEKARNLVTKMRGLPACPDVRAVFALDGVLVRGSRSDVT
jgi:2-methylcitrate dehydratase